MRDDGAGVFASRQIMSLCEGRNGVHCLDGGTLGYLLIGNLVETNGLIVIDAAHLNAPPGTVKVFHNDAMDFYLNTHPNRSIHEVGLGDLMTMASLSGDLPTRRALIAIQPKETDWGTELSNEVAANMPIVCRHALAIIDEWQR